MREAEIRALCVKLASADLSLSYRLKTDDETEAWINRRAKFYYNLITEEEHPPI